MKTIEGAAQEGRTRSVLVTGAAGGLGRAIVAELRDQDWAVIATDRDGADLDGLRAEYRHVTGVDVRTLDVTDHSSVMGVADRLDSLTALVNVAGVLQDPVPLRGLEEEAQRRIWEVNYFGAVRCTRLLTPLMNQGTGCVVNITSINQLSPLPLYAYAPSKAALGCFTRLAAGELAIRGIRVNAVAPGFTLTPALAARIRLGERDPESIERHTASGRLVQPREVATAVAFLLGDAAGGITGATLPVDAGWLATAHWMDFGDRLDRWEDPAVR
ncbi:SDR family NAD(P)-dependent oxidoreductase [Streptosporangium saharense]|uniref:SDR family NAD(P)-dependent oxidoreductase n=1 Tax=Streptosporangium saharense TaxID=1706840 RepID=UPI003448395B